MLNRGVIARKVTKLIPAEASISADTPLLPLVSQREVVLRFPEHVKYLNRKDTIKNVDWVLAFPNYYLPFIPLFKEESSRWQLITHKLKALATEGEYGVKYCEGGVIALNKGVQSSTEAMKCLDESIKLNRIHKKASP